MENKRIYELTLTKKVIQKNTTKVVSFQTSDYL